MARRKNVKRIDPRYFLHETVLREMTADIAKRIDQVVGAAVDALKKVAKAPKHSLSSQGPDRSADLARTGEGPGSKGYLQEYGKDLPVKGAEKQMRQMVAQLTPKLDEAAALSLGRGGSRRTGDVAQICPDAYEKLGNCPDEMHNTTKQQLCEALRDAIAALSCLDDGQDGMRWLESQGLLKDVRAVYAALHEFRRNYFSGSQQRNEGGLGRAEGEVLDEDVFSAIGDTATKFFGSKEGKRELFWRKQGKARAEEFFDSAYGDSAEEDFLDKEDILHDARTIFMDMKGNPKFQASKAVKAAVGQRKGGMEAYAAGVEKKHAERDRWQKEKKDKAAAQRKAHSDAMTRKPGNWFRKHQQQVDAQNKATARAHIPGAGQSTDHKRREENRSRRTNRDELKRIVREEIKRTLKSK